MTRITTDQPSSGKPINIHVPVNVNNGFVDTSYIELCEAPDFSVPSNGDPGVVFDGSSTEREVRSGEIFFESPLIAHNATGTNRWVQLEMVLPSTGASFEGGHFIPAGPGGGASGRVFMTPRNSVDARLYDVATNTLTIPNGVFTAAQFLGSVRLNDGRIYLIPHGVGTGFLYDPATDTFTAAGGTFPTATGQHTGTLLNDGRVFVVPFNDNVARIYNPVTNTLTVAGGTYVPQAHLCGVTLTSGRVFLPAWRSGQCAVYDPVANTKTAVGPAFSADAFGQGVRLNDGRVFCPPVSVNALRPIVYDPVANTVAYVSTNWGPNIANAHWAAVLLSDGRVYLPGYGSVRGRIWDPVTDTSTVPNGEFAGDLEYRTAVRLADGKVFCIPYNAISARIYDPVANTLTTPAGSYPSPAVRVTLTPQLVVPANGTISISIQGQRLLNPARASSTTTAGGKLLARAEVNNAIKVIGSASELEAKDHAPNTD